MAAQVVLDAAVLLRCLSVVANFTDGYLCEPKYDCLCRDDLEEP